MKTKIFIIAACMATLAACGGKQDKTEENNKQEISAEDIFDPNSAQNSLDWAGEYTNDTITVILHEDLSFTFKAQGISEKGYFVWDVDGNVIAMEKADGGYALFKVEENRLVNGSTVLLKKQ